MSRNQLWVGHWMAGQGPQKFSCSFLDYVVGRKLRWLLSFLLLVYLPYLIPSPLTWARPVNMMGWPSLLWLDHAIWQGWRDFADITKIFDQLSLNESNLFRVSLIWSGDPLKEKFSCWAAMLSVRGARGKELWGHLEPEIRPWLIVNKGGPLCHIHKGLNSACNHVILEEDGEFHKNRGQLTPCFPPCDTLSKGQATLCPGPGPQKLRDNKCALF